MTRMPITRHFKDAKAACTTIDSEFRRHRIHKGQDQIIPENNFSADNAVPQVHMIINFASWTCHRMAFLISSDSSTCTIFSGWHQCRRRDLSLRNTDEGNSAAWLPWQFIRRASSTRSWRWRGAVEDSPSEQSMGFFLFTITSCCCGASARSAFLAVSPQPY